MHCIRILAEAHRFRGAPISRPPNPMSSIFAALVSGHIVSTRILMKYALHTDTGRGAPILRSAERRAGIFAALISGRFLSKRILMKYAWHTDSVAGAAIATPTKPV